ncbi:hypothetical protein D3C71_2211170 [compost metagenome]
MVLVLMSNQAEVEGGNMLRFNQCGIRSLYPIDLFEIIGIKRIDMDYSRFSFDSYAFLSEEPYSCTAG